MVKIEYKTMNVIYYLAAVYGSGPYGNSTYSSTSTTGDSADNGTQGSTGTPATSPAPESSNNLLANTGFDLILAATIASAVIFAALIIRFYRKSRKAA